MRGGISQNREAVHFFVLLFLVANLFLLLTVILLFVRAKTLYLMVIPDFSDYLGLSQPLKKKSSLFVIFFFYKSILHGKIKYKRSTF